MAIGLTILAVVALNVFGRLALSNQRLDVTQQSVFSIETATRELLDKIEEPLTLTFFRSSQLRSVDPKIASYAERVHSFLTSLDDVAGDRIRLVVQDPEPFSFEEDRAVALGLEAIDVGAGEENAYLAIAFEDLTDRLAVIEQLDPAREAFLERDLGRLLRQLLYPEKPTVQLLAGPSILHDAGRQGRSRIIAELQQLYSLKELNAGDGQLGVETDVILLMAPQDLGTRDIERIDAFLNSGGGLLTFLDRERPTDPELARWLAGLGLTVLEPSTAIGDATDAQPIQLQDAELSDLSPITRTLVQVNLRDAGIIEVDSAIADATIPLLSAPMENGSEGRERPLAVLLDRNPGRVLLVADIDMLRDELWTASGANEDSGPGLPIADNARFVANAIDSLSGRATLSGDAAEDLGRRTFIRLDDIRRATSAQFVTNELELLRRIETLELSMLERTGLSVETGMIEAIDDAVDIGTLRQDLVNARLELREIRRAQRQQIDRLERNLILLNVAVMPLVVAIIGLIFMIAKGIRYRGRYTSLQA